VDAILHRISLPVIPASFRHALFPAPTLGAIEAAGFPTLFSTASGVNRPHSRAVQRLSVAGVLSEAFQLASAGGCATDLRTRPRHVYDRFPRVLTA
jgi:hypothetical protein